MEHTIMPFFSLSVSDPHFRLLPCLLPCHLTLPMHNAQQTLLYAQMMRIPTHKWYSQILPSILQQVVPLECRRISLAYYEGGWHHPVPLLTAAEAFKGKKCSVSNKNICDLVNWPQNTLLDIRQLFVVQLLTTQQQQTKSTHYEI